MATLENIRQRADAFGKSSKLTSDLLGRHIGANEPFIFLTTVWPSLVLLC